MEINEIKDLLYHIVVHRYCKVLHREQLLVFHGLNEMTLIRETKCTYLSVIVKFKQ